MRQSHLRRLSLASASIILVGLGGTSWAQTSPQDGIDRNLQQREARQREFHASLQDRQGPPPPLAGGFEPKWNFLMLPSGGEPPLRLPLPTTPMLSTHVPEPSVVNSEVQLRDSQQRRQLELQTQTGTQVPGVPDPGRQQALQAQQLGFEREIRAQELQSNILRDSGRAMGTKP